MILSLHQLQGGLLGPVFYSSIYVPRLDRTFWNNDEQRINQKKQAFLYGQRINADADPRQDMRFALLEKLAIAKRFGIESHCRFASATSQTRNGWNRCATLFFLAGSRIYVTFTDVAMTRRLSESNAVEVDHSPASEFCLIRQECWWMAVDGWGQELLSSDSLKSKWWQSQKWQHVRTLV